MNVKHIQDLFAGALFVLVGAAFLWAGQDFEIGTARSMGPAYFPSLLAVLQLLLGLAVIGMAFQSQDLASEPLAPTDWRGLLLICGSVVLFAQLLPVAGFVIAGPVLVLLASLATPETPMRHRLMLSVGLTAFCVLVFRVGLDMRFPLLPPALL